MKRSIDDPEAEPTEEKIHEIPLATQESSEKKGHYGDHEPQIEIHYEEGSGISIFRHESISSVTFGEVPLMNPQCFTVWFTNCQTYKAVYCVKDSSGQMSRECSTATTFEELIEKLSDLDIHIIYYYFPDEKIVMLVIREGLYAVGTDDLQTYWNKTLVVTLRGFYSGSLTNYKELSQFATFFRFEIDNYNLIPVANRQFNKFV